MSSKAYASSKKSTIDSLTLFILCILVFYPPFFRGLFFQKELLITHIITFGIFSIWIISKLKDERFKLVETWTDILALGMVFMYFISIFYGVNKRWAIAEFMKYGNFLAIYLLVRYFAKGDDKNKGLIINILLASGIVVSIIGVGSAIGTIEYNGAYVSGRINSSFQYPNTLASYLIAVFILAMGQFQSTDSLMGKIIYGMAANIYIFTFIPTFSRGMWLLAPIIILGYLILIPGTKKIQGLLACAITIIPAIGLSLIFIRDIESRSSLILWMMFIASPAVSALLTFLLKNVLDYSKSTFKKLALILIALGILAFGLFALAMNITEPLALSNMDGDTDKTSLIDRDVRGIKANSEYVFETSYYFENPEEKAYAGRVYIYSINKEGETKVIVDNPIVEGDYLSINFTTLEDTEKIRIRFYNRLSNTMIVFKDAVLIDGETKEVIRDIKLKYKYIPENIVRRLSSITDEISSDEGRKAFYRDGIKVVRDYPIFGAGGGAWKTLYFKYQSYMYWTTEAHNFFLQLWIEIGTLGLLIFVIFLLVLLINGFKNLIDGKTNSRIVQASVIMGIICILGHSFIDFDLSLGAMAILLWSLFALIEQEKFHLQDFKGGKYGRYVLCGFTILLALGAISLQRSEAYANEGIRVAQLRDYEKAAEFFEKASKFDPFTSSYQVDLSTLYYMISEDEDEEYLEKSLKAMEKSVNLAPFDSRVLTKAGQLCLQVGKIDEGIEYIKRAVEAQPMNGENYITAFDLYLRLANLFIRAEDIPRIESIAKDIQYLKEYLLATNERAMKPIGYNKALNEKLGLVQYLMDNRNDIKSLKDIKNIVLYDKFNIDLDKNGMPDGSRISNTEEGKLTHSILGDYGISITNEGADYGVFWIDDINLEEDTSYEFILEYESSVENKDFDINIYDYTEKSNVIYSIADIDNQKNLLKVEFTTPEGIETGKQRIGIIHRGNGGEIKIKHVIIKEI